jgi:hypothetical protein
MQILADRIEFCWIHLEGIGTLENSLWGYDGRGIRLWLDALTLEDPASNNPVDGAQSSESVQESVNIPLSFYPLCELGLYVTARKLISVATSRTNGQGDHYWSGT